MKKLLIGIPLLGLLLWGATSGNIQWTQLRSGDRHGTAAKGQSSDGTGTSGHIALFDASGGVTNGGLPGSSISQSVQTWNYSGGGTAQVVQTKSCEADSTTCTTAAMTVTAGNLLVVTVSSFGISTPTSSVSDTFSAATTDPGNGVNQRMWYTCSAVGGSTTFTMTGGSRAVHIHVLEISGNATTSCLDQHTQTGGSGVSVTALSITSGSVAQASEIAVASFNSNFSTCASITADTGTTNELATLSTATASGNWPVITNVYDQNTGLSGAITMGATCGATSGFWNANIATFKLSAPAGSAPNADLSIANTFKITLTGSVIGSTWSNQAAGLQVSMVICQDSTGGWTFAWPSTTTGGMTIGSTLSKCNAQTFVSDGTTMIATSSGVTNQ